MFPLRRAMNLAFMYQPSKERAAKSQQQLFCKYIKPARLSSDLILRK
jgi:hypothetical protein